MNFLLKAEHYLVNGFSRWCQSPHWSFFWVLWFIVWTVVRETVHPKWYSSDLDLLVITWTSAIVPFMVENSLKAAQGAQLEKQQKTVDLLLKVAELNSELCKKILAATVEIKEDIDHDGPKQ